MKEKFLIPEIELVLFLSNDVITTSSEAVEKEKDDVVWDNF